MRSRRVLCSIVPPHVLRNIAERGDASDRVHARAAIELSTAPRNQRQAVAQLAGMLTLAPRRKRRTVFDARNASALPGLHVRREGSRRVRDVAVNEAYEGAGKTYDFFRRVYGRFSIDDGGVRLDSTVHYGERFSNAHWNGRQMIYGDGDGKYFNRFTSSLDVIAHELTHGVIQYTAALGATAQAGALGEHFADVFATLVKQYSRGETAAEADWLIGAGLFTDRVSGSAIRSLKAPGTAYDDPVLGRDPQPSHMRDYVRTRSNDGGVHINSGIPNHAFYLVASALGGYAWDTAGRIWYRALTRELHPRARFQHCADATWGAACDLFGAAGPQQDAVRAAWSAVGIEVSAAARRSRSRASTREPAATFEPPTAGAELPAFGIA